MAKTSLLGAFVLFVGSALLWVAPANAQATRTWVSGVGDDANPCSRTAPCKTFAGAISKTADCGEIDALDPGGFGALTITKGITIDGGGGQVASVLVAGTNGFVIANSDPTCQLVILRNLKFQGLAPASGAGLTAIKVIQGNLVIEHVQAQNFSQDCVNYQSTTPGTLTVINSDFVNCGPAALEVGYSSGGAKVSTATVTGSTFEDSTVGVLADAFGRISLHGSMISNNSTGGVEASGSDAWVSLDNSSITGNVTYQVYATNSGDVLVASDALIYTSGTTFKTDTGGHIVTFSNNWPYFYSALGATTTVAAPQ